MRSMMRTDLFWWRESRTAAKSTGANGSISLAPRAQQSISSGAVVAGILVDDEGANALDLAQ
jgi:hypothetical protein